jgi:hypothetical protein
MLKIEFSPMPFLTTTHGVLQAPVGRVAGPSTFKGHEVREPNHAAIRHRAARTEISEPVDEQNLRDVHFTDGQPSRIT